MSRLKSSLLLFVHAHESRGKEDPNIQSYCFNRLCFHIFWCFHLHRSEPPSLSFSWTENLEQNVKSKIFFSTALPVFLTANTNIFYQTGWLRFVQKRKKNCPEVTVII